MVAAPSQTADAQAWKRARSRYPLEPDDDGFYVRGRREEDGTWTPVPCACFKCLVTLPMVKFVTVKEGVDHEFTALEERRAKWKNLASEQQSLAKHVSAEQAATSSQELLAKILQLQSSKHDKVEEEKTNKEEDRMKRTIMLKKPRTAYWMWLHENRSSIVQEHFLQGKKGSKISKKAGDLWRSLGLAEKTKYQEMAAADKIRYIDKIMKIGQHTMKLTTDEKCGTMTKQHVSKCLQDVPAQMQVSEPALSQAQKEIISQNRVQAMCRRHSRIQAQNTVLSQAQHEMVAQNRAQAMERKRSIQEAQKAVR